MLQRRVLLGRLRVEEDRMTLAEGAACAVLADESNRIALEQERAERQQLGEGPVERLALLELVQPGFQHAGRLRMSMEAGRDARGGLRDLLQRLERDCRDEGRVAVLRDERLPGAVEAAHAARGPFL